MNRLRALVLGLALASCTCQEKATVDAGPVDAGPLALTEQEPNDGPAAALVVPGNAVVQGNLGADPRAPDEDWYALTSPVPRTARVEVTCPPGADVALDVVDEAGTTLTRVNQGGPDAAELLPNLDVPARAYLRVTGLKKGAGGGYTLTAFFQDRLSGFELEPDDRRVDATAVPMGQAVSGYLSHATDEDWYRFELPVEGEPAPGLGAEPDAGAPDDGGAEAGPPGTDSAPTGESDAGDAAPQDAGEAPDAGAPPAVPRTPLRVDISGVEGVRFEVSVLTEAEAVLFASKSAAEGAGLSLRNVGIRATDRVIYVVVKSAWSGAGKEQRRGANGTTYYTLTVAEEEAGASAELEPNDDLEHATPLAADSYREGFITPRGDVDHYVLEVASPSLVDVTLTGVDGLDLQLSLVRPSAKGPGQPDEVALKANDGAAKEPESLQAIYCEQACVFRVEPAPRKVDGKWVKDAENATVPYRVETRVTPEDGSREREPNNAPADATALELGQPRRGTVFPKKDVDLFRLDLTARQVRTPIKATLTGVLKVDLGLYLHRLEDDGKLTLVQTGDRAKGDRPETVKASLEPGVYVFEVRDSKGRDANFQDLYQLTVDEADE